MYLFHKNRVKNKTTHLISVFDICIAISKKNCYLKMKVPKKNATTVKKFNVIMSFYVYFVQIDIDRFYFYLFFLLKKTK